jgi:hypothetical protein
MLPFYYYFPDSGIALSGAKVKPEITFSAILYALKA